MFKNNKDIQLKKIRAPNTFLNPIPTGQGRNQPLYERQVTKSGRNMVKYLTRENIELRMLLQKLFPPLLKFCREI